MRLFLAVLISAFLALFSAPQARAAGKQISEGLWLTDDRSLVVSVKPCGDTICGTVYWFEDDIPPFDVKNPDPARRRIPLCGLNVLGGFRQVSDHEWIDGTVYISATGDTYRATVQLLPSGNAVVRGYIFMPLFGQSMILTPVSKKDYPECRKPKMPQRGPGAL
jgi:uncharacterized protein (DUF2147 family)